MIASFRMYAAVPAAARAWEALFSKVFSELALPIEVIEHRWPLPIAELWGRPDLACGFMCGWPFERSGAMQAIAAPVPSPARYEGLPRYCSEFLVREDSGWTALEETFGHRFGWMASDSQSGFNAPRAHLASHVTAQRPALYREVLGPLGAPMSTLQALRESRVDVVALDGFFLDLCRRHEPARLAGLRCIATTPWTPIPLLAAAPGIDAGTIEALRRHLAGLHERDDYRALLSDTLLQRFVAPDLPAYAALEAMAESATRLGYATIR